MKSVTLQAHTGPDGNLRLDVPTGFADTDVDVVVVIQPHVPVAPAEGQDAHGWPVGFLERTFRSIPDLVDVDEKYVDGRYVCDAAGHDHGSNGS